MDASHNPAECDTMARRSRWPRSKKLNQALPAAILGAHGSFEGLHYTRDFEKLTGSLATTRILLVDDFDQWRLAARLMIETIPAFRVIGEASNGLDAVEKAAMLLPHLVILDIGMPVLNGIDAARRIRQVCPESRIVFLTENDDDEVRHAALATGAMGYVVKSTAACELLPTVHRALLSDGSRRHP